MNKKVAIISGASGDIGRVLSEQFLENDYRVALLYNNNDVCINEKVSLDDYLLVKCDLTKKEDIENAVKEIFDRFEKVDVLVNNAAVSIDKLFYDRNIEDFEKTFAVNVFGTFYLSKIVGEKMLDNGGVIINISSTNGINTYFPMCIDYDASKSAINSLTHNLAVQFAPKIRVNAVAPGFIGTKKELDGMDKEFVEFEKNKVLVKRYGTPIDVANLVMFLASDKASFINNQIICLDGGVYGSV